VAIPLTRPVTFRESHALGKRMTGLPKALPRCPQDVSQDIPRGCLPGVDRADTPDFMPGWKCALYEDVDRKTGEARAARTNNEVARARTATVRFGTHHRYPRACAGLFLCSRLKTAAERAGDGN
jgi:hypothetical protein